MDVARFSCPNCGTVLTMADPRPAGRTVKCRNCDYVVSDVGAEAPAEAAIHDNDAYGDHPSRAKTNDNTALILLLVIFVCVALLAGGGALLIWHTQPSDEPKVLFKPEGLEEPKPVKVGHRRRYGARSARTRQGDPDQA